MADNPKIEKLSDFSSRGLGELKAWMEIWFPPSQGGCCIEWEDVGVDCSGSIWGSYEEVLRLTGGLVGYWKLDDALDFGGTFTSGGSFGDQFELEKQSGVVLDSSGLDNHMDYARVNETVGSPFAPLDISLVTGYADLPGGASPQAFEWLPSGGTLAMATKSGSWVGMTTPIKSVSFWFKTLATGTPSGWMLGSHVGGVSGGSSLVNTGWSATLGGFSSILGVGSTAGRIEIWYGDGASGSSVLAMEGPFVANDTWYHLAITSDGTTNTLYVNGLNVDTYTAVGNILETNTASFFGLGMQGYKSGFQILASGADGVILDEVAMWTETVSEYHAGLQAHG